MGVIALENRVVASFLPVASRAQMAGGSCVSE